jgi:2-amino-4-hydroxy-6-hydroxymethyldihydropteridine diphosphokinase
MQLADAGSKYLYLLGFGSNLGDKTHNCRQGLLLLSQFGNLLQATKWELTQPLTSAWYSTDDHGEYLNFVCLYSSPLDPWELYSEIESIENQVGHNRKSKWLPRQLDIDILMCTYQTHSYFENCIPFLVHAPSQNGLCIPHKDFWNRPFWWQPILNELKIPMKALNLHFGHNENHLNFEAFAP